MEPLENIREHIYCARCAELVERNSVGTGQDKNAVVPRGEEGSRTTRLLPDHEEYLQIPTYLLLGRRLS